MPYETSVIPAGAATRVVDHGYTQHKGRRQYRPAFKVRAVEETLLPGASVSIVARRYNINTNVVFRWLAEYRQGKFDHLRKTRPTGLVPIGVIGDDGHAKPIAASGPVLRPTPAPATPKPAKSRVTLALSGRMTLNFDSEIDADALRRILDIAKEFA